MRNTTSLLGVLLAVGLGGCGSVSAGGDQPDAFVDLRPVIESVSPDHGPAGGGIQLTLAGSGFSGDTLVVVGGRAASNVTVVSDGEITCDLPPGEYDAQVTVTVINDNGFANLLQAFTYNSAPTAGEVSPAYGSAVGGTEITIHGTGFADNAASVLVDGVAATSVVVVDDETITAETPAMADGPAMRPLDVVVETSSGTVVLAGAFRYTRPGLLIGRLGRTTGIEDSEASHSLYYYDIQAKAFVPLFPVDWGLQALGLHPDGTVYGVTNRRGLIRQRYLMTLDPLTQEMHSIGPVLMAGTTEECNVADIAFNGGTLYGLRSTYNAGNFHSLVTIDLTTGECTDVSATRHSLNAYRWAALAVKDATTFYAVPYLNSSLYQIGINNELVGSPVPLPEDSSYEVAGGVFAAGKLWAVRRGSGQLIQINTSTGAIENIETEQTLYYPRAMCRTPPSMN